MEIKLDKGFLKFPELLSDIEKKLLPTAHRRALQKTLTTLKGVTRQALQERYQLPAKVLTPRIKTVLSEDKTTGILWIGLAPIPVAKLDKPQQTPQGVAVAGQHYPSAFIATMKNGHRGVYQRKTKARLPVQTVTLALVNAESLLRSHVLQEAIPTYQHYLAQAWQVLTQKGK